MKVLFVAAISIFAIYYDDVFKKQKSLEK